MKRAFRRLFPRLSFRMRYARGVDGWSANLPRQQFLSVLAELPPGKALDLGCGRGQNTFVMEDHGWEATGVDFVPEVIKAAQEKARIENSRARFLVGDVTDLPELTDQYDLIIDIGCFHSLAPVQRAPYRANLLRLLAPGGTYLLYAANQPPERQPPGLTQENLDEFVEHLTLNTLEHITNRRGRPGFWARFTRP